MKQTMVNFAILLFLSFSTSAFSDSTTKTKLDTRYQPSPFVEINAPDWAKNATIYQVNVRQYTKEGTFKAFESHLPRLKELGIDILWLMPIHPIGEINRKGKMGSYYAVKDYLAVNPDFGTVDDLKHLVDKIHSMGMYVILDWVPNHSAWDNALTHSNPDWYKRDKEGNFLSNPWWDWADVIEFDYDKPELRRYMTDALKYWVKEVGVDGYRADTAGYVPTAFWNNVREELEQIKPVFMLAEAELRDLHQKAFDLAYSFRLHDVLHDVAQGKKNAKAIYSHFGKLENRWRLDMLRMNFVDNHDLNAWDHPANERFGPFLNASIVLTATVEGIPLIYSGQEAGLDRSLEFFDKDQIEWKPHPTADLYKTLFNLKHKNTALWNGKWGSHMLPAPNNNKENIISYVREKDKDKVFVVINFSDKLQSVSFEGKGHLGNYSELFNKETQHFDKNTQLIIEPYGYRVYVAE